MDYTESVQNAVSYAERWVRKNFNSFVGTEHLLLGIINTECRAEERLREYGVTNATFRLSSDRNAANIIEFTPEETGEYIYTCWMNMIRNHIQVIDDESYFEEA